MFWRGWYTNVIQMSTHIISESLCSACTLVVICLTAVCVEKEYCQHSASVIVGVHGFVIVAIPLRTDKCWQSHVCLLIYNFCDAKITPLSAAAVCLCLSHFIVLACFSRWHTCSWGTLLYFYENRKGG